MNNACAIEKRLSDHYPKEAMIGENTKALKQCIKYGCDYVFIDKNYDFNV